MRIHPLWALALWLGCAAAGPDESLGCEAFAAQWEEAGPFEVLGCRQRGGRLDEEGGARRYTMELEAELRVLETTQIFAAQGLEHRSGPEGEGARRPAGEVVRLRGEVLLVETEAGWQLPAVTAPR